MKKHIVQLKNWILILAVLLSFESLSKDVKAASGNVYSCQIARTYEHPVTGKVEDSGGSSSKATGQGMVEGAISSKGLLEVTDAGDDYTSDLSFSVQKRGESRFQTQSVTQTATGKDNNGTTKDLRIKLSSQDSIIRCSMYVKPMGRNVIFYFYPGNYTTGNSVGMKALMVTTSSSDTQTSDNNQTQTTADTNNTASQQTTTASQGADTQSSDDSLSNAQGLSLSTAPKTTTKKKTSSEKSVGTWILILTVSMTFSGLVLLGVAATIVYYYRKNWDKWGGDQDEYDEIYNDEN